jgi:hypothetical protein
VERKSKSNIINNRGNLNHPISFRTYLSYIRGNQETGDKSFIGLCTHNAEIARIHRLATMFLRRLTTTTVLKTEGQRYKKIYKKYL